jgi:histidinol dehydrogenase
MAQIRKLDSSSAGFRAELSALLAFEAGTDAAIEQAVAAILADVKARGDAAVLEYTRRFDRLAIDSVASLEISRAELQAALDKLPAARRGALETAAARVKMRFRRLPLYRSRRHRARAKGHAAGPRRHLRPRRQGCLSVFGPDERNSGQGGGRRRRDHGRAHARRREE